MTEETASGAGDTSRARRTLYVGGLAEQVDVKTLTAAFIPFGEINDVQIPMDNVENKNRGFGFVEFADEADATDALANMDASELFGRTLRVTVARPMMKKNAAVWEEAESWFKTLPQDGDGVGETLGDER